MILLGIVTGYFIGIIFGCLLIGIHVADFGLTVMFLLPSAGAFLGGIISWFIGWKTKKVHQWPLGLSLLLVLILDLSLAIMSTLFWGSIPKYESIRPMGYSLFDGLSALMVGILGVVTAAIDFYFALKGVTEFKQVRWRGIIAGLLAIMTGLLVFPIDQSIMHHFQRVHHFVFED